MNNRAFTISAVLALLGVFMVWSWISTREAEIQKNFGAEVGVVVAKQDIKELDIIDETKVEVTTVPRKFFQKGAASDIREVANSIATIPIKKGQQITYTMVTAVGGRTGVSRQVSEGKRAITIPVNDISGVGRLIKPGDRVDVIGSIQFGDKKDTRAVTPILQDVPILAIGRLVTNNPPAVFEKDDITKNTITKNLIDYDSFNNVTIEVDPNDTLRIAYLLSTGDSHLYLTLRNNQDKERLDIKPISMKDVMNVTAVPAPVRK